MRKLLFLPLILLFISCSVTKRVHRPGFHIQWHKIHRAPSAEKQQQVSREKKRENSIQEVASPSQKISENVSQKDSLITHLTNKKETTSILSTKPQTKKRFSRLSTMIQKTELPSILKSSPKKTKTASLKSKRPIFWRMSAKKLKKLGGVLIFFGVLILIGGLMSYAGAFTGGSSGAWANFFIDLIEISEWFWILAFILVIVLLLYLSVLLVRHVFGGFLIGSIIGLSLLVLGVFFRTLGKNREIEV